MKEWIRKWQKQILCIAGSILLFAAASYSEKMDHLSGLKYLERNGYGEDSRTYDLLIEGIHEEALPYSVEISPLQYSQAEAEAVFEELFAQLPGMILGENKSLDHVTTDLNLINLFDKTGVRVSWQSKNPDILDSYGRIAAERLPSEGEPVILEVALTDGIHKKEGYLELRVFPPFRSVQEEVAAILTERIREADLEHPEERQVELPQEYEGQEIRYHEAPSSNYRILPLFGIILAVLFHEQERVKEEKKRKERRQQLQMDYADVVYQMMVYTGAGLTVRKTWEQMVENYEKKRNVSNRKRFAYEEMTLTLHQMQYGVPEGKAIIEFGRRCQLQSYLKLSSLLEQNRKTGTKNLNQMLEQEMASAWEEKKHAARRMGEEAGTKLLAPLFLMLIVVMVIIMVPALAVVQI